MRAPFILTVSLFASACANTDIEKEINSYLKLPGLNNNNNASSLFVSDMGNADSMSDFELNGIRINDHIRDVRVKYPGTIINKYSTKSLKNGSVISSYTLVKQNEKYADYSMRKRIQVSTLNDRVIGISERVHRKPRLDCSNIVDDYTTKYGQPLSHEQFRSVIKSEHNKKRNAERNGYTYESTHPYIKVFGWKGRPGMYGARRSGGYAWYKNTGEALGISQKCNKKVSHYTLYLTNNSELEEQLFKE
ncbi:MAG: hypothetical protein OEY52_02990 [Gammaproteobacteria bacterium]|nr:hypothetical protein [Gammaproteobacteria bacterium]